MGEIKTAGNVLERMVKGNLEKICEKHGSYVSYHFGGDYSGCPQCAKELEEEEIGRLDHPAKPKYLQSDFKDMNIDEMFYESTLDNFEAYTDNLKKAVDLVQMLITTGRGKIMLAGNNGTGKTHLAASAVKALGGSIYTVFEVNLMLQETYGYGEKREKKVLDNLINLPLLALDEVGKTKATDWEINWISHVLNKRHTRYKPVIFTTNKHTKVSCPKQGCPDCVEHFVGADIISRFNEDGVILNFTEGDYRYKKRAGNV